MPMSYYVITEWAGEKEIHGPCSKQVALDFIRTMGSLAKVVLVKEIPLKLVAEEE